MPERHEWYVSRQHQYYGGAYVVEVAFGGLDYSGSDMLVAQYPQEGETFTDPREALKAAREIRKLWQNDKSATFIGISFGATGGIFTQIEAAEDEDDLDAQAEAAWEKVPKCDHCGEARNEDYYVPHLDNDEKYCSENCANQVAEAHAETEAKAFREEVEEKVNRLDRESLVTLLEDYAGIATNDDEPIEDLREAVVENVMDETLSMEDIDMELAG